MLCWHFWSTEDMLGEEGSPLRQKPFRLQLINYPTPNFLSLAGEHSSASLLSPSLSYSWFSFTRRIYVWPSKSGWHWNEGTLCDWVGWKYPQVEQKFQILYPRKVWLKFVSRLQSYLDTFSHFVLASHHSSVIGRRWIRLLSYISWKRSFCLQVGMPSDPIAAYQCFNKGMFPPCPGQKVCLWGLSTGMQV